jgi:hypothetical protein
MSDDLVQRLRESVKACRALDRSALLAEAAGEIERLRIERDGWKVAWENERYRRRNLVSGKYKKIRKLVSG